VSQFIENIVDKHENSQSESGEREEWMYLAELKLNTDSNKSKQTSDLPATYWQNDRLKYTSQQTGDMPYWIDTQKNLSSQNPSMSTHLILALSTIHSRLPMILLNNISYKEQTNNS